MQALIKHKTWEIADFSLIRKGDIFRIISDEESVEEDGCYVWKALSKAVKTDDGEWIVAKEKMPSFGKAPNPDEKT